MSAMRQSWVLAGLYVSATIIDVFAVTSKAFKLACRAALLQSRVLDMIVVHRSWALQDCMRCAYSRVYIQ